MIKYAVYMTTEEIEGTINTMKSIRDHINGGISELNETLETVGTYEFKRKGEIKRALSDLVEQREGIEQEIKALMTHIVTREVEERCGD